MVIVIPQIIRGKVLMPDDYPEHATTLKLPNGAEVRFVSPAFLVGQMVVTNEELSEMHGLDIREVRECLSRAGKQISPDRFAAALEYDEQYGVLSGPLLEEDIKKVRFLLNDLVLRILLRNEVDLRLFSNGRPLIGTQWAVEKAVGQRCVHFMPGHTPIVQILDAVKAILSKGSHVFITSPDDPLSLPAFVNLLVSANPGHALIRNLSVVFWPPEQTLQPLLQAGFVDRFVFWGEPIGGREAPLHAREVNSSGVKVVNFGSRASISIVGREVSSSQQTMREVAVNIAKDLAAYNQFSCGASRRVYAQLNQEQCQQLATLVLEELHKLPSNITTPFSDLPVSVSGSIKNEILNGTWYVGRLDGSGIVLVGNSNLFASHRSLVIVPVQDFVKEVMPRIPSYTQTVGLFPFRRLHDELWTQLTARGACRLIELGGAVDYTPGGPFNGFNQTLALTQRVLVEHRPTNRLVFYTRLVINLLFNR